MHVTLEPAGAPWGHALLALAVIALVIGIGVLINWMDKQWPHGRGD